MKPYELQALGGICGDLYLSLNHRLALKAKVLDQFASLTEACPGPRTK